MKKNLVLMITLILVVCGCSAEYKLKINKDLSVEETVIALEDAQFFNAYKNSSMQRVIGFMLEPHLDYFNDNGYLLQDTIAADMSEGGTVITNKFPTIEKYKSTSEFSKQLAEDWEYTLNGNEITLSIKGAFNTAEQDQSGRYPVETASISIQLPFKVIDHNADRVDAKTGTYTWLIDTLGQEKEIMITFDKSVTSGINEIYFIIGGIIVVIAFGALIVYNKITGSKDRNNLS